MDTTEISYVNTGRYPSYEELLQKCERWEVADLIKAVGFEKYIYGADLAVSFDCLFT